MTIDQYHDDFAQRGLPPESLQPKYVFPSENFVFPDSLNCVERLLDQHIKDGNGDKICIRTFDETWTYRQLFEKSNQIANVLVDDLKLKSGNRVLVRSANNPMFVATWFGVLKAGGIVVATMPLLREKELSVMVECAEISHVISDEGLMAEVDLIKLPFLKSVCSFGNSPKGNLEKLMSSKPKDFDNVVTKDKSIALIGFTSGTTGKPKMTAHFHQDVLLICEAFPKYSLSPKPWDIFTGSPPLGFTFGLGGLVLFPFYYGASTFLIEKPTPEILLKAIQDHKITICFTAPTAWRIITTLVDKYDVSSLRKCISAGETLPLQVWQDWFEKTGLKIIDGIGSTEILHIFISSNDENIVPGATGFSIYGYDAKVIDEAGNECDHDIAGRLAVQGITGCKYLYSTEKQREYAENGWNITGDIFRRDKNGVFWFVARGDDMIISSGYNISAIEVENVLLMHDNILECAVVGLPDQERGMIVCANIVLKNPTSANENSTRDIQDWFKQTAAPYKYPRQIYFVESLPKTETGKIQRFKLKNQK